MSKLSVQNLENKTAEEICDLLDAGRDCDAVQTKIKNIAELDKNGSIGMIDGGFETYLLAQSLIDQHLGTLSLTARDLKKYQSRHNIPELTVDPIFDPGKTELPDFTKLTIEEFARSCEITFVALSHDLTVTLKDFASPRFQATWDNVLVPTAEILLSLRRVENYIALAENLHMPTSAAGKSTDDYDKLVLDLKNKKTDLKNALLQNQNYYRALTQLQGSSLKLDDEQKRILTYRVDQAKRSGAALATEQQAALNGIKTKLDGLYATFNSNMTASSEEQALIVTDPAQLVGIPESKLNEWKITDPVNGAVSWKIPATKGNYAQILQNCSVRATRQTMYEHYFGKGAPGTANDNTSVLAEMIALRQEQAKLMGYDNYSAMINDQKSSFASVEQAEEFLSDWIEALTPGMAREAELYGAALAKDGFDPESFAPWDMYYYAKSVSPTASAFQPSNYDFPFSELKKQTFAQIEKLYSVTIRAKENPNVWDKSVETYDVFDQQTGDVIGEFYWDAYSRDGKSGTNFTAEIQTGELSADGQHLLKIPICLCNTNFTQPAANGETNLTIAEAQNTVFHELGHVMHMILGSRPRQELSGVRPMESISDLSELPGILLEAWFNDPQTMAGIARNKKDGSAPALADIEAYQKQLDPIRPFLLASNAALGIADLSFHADAAHPENHVNVYNNLLRTRLPYRLSLPNVIFNALPHMSTNEYPGAYYGYALPQTVVPLIVARAKADPTLLRRAYSMGSSLTSAEFLELLTGQKIDGISFDDTLKAEHLQQPKN